jgi:hypothetical protein
MTKDTTPAIPSGTGFRAKIAAMKAGAADVASAIAGVISVQPEEHVVTPYGVFVADEHTARWARENELQERLTSLAQALDFGAKARPELAQDVQTLLDSLQPENTREREILSMILRRLFEGSPLLQISQPLLALIDIRRFAVGGAILLAAKRVPDRFTVQRDPGQPLGHGARGRE